MLMALVVLVIGITAPGYGDDDHDDGKNHHVEKFLRLSGPAIEGALGLAIGNVAFFGTCRGPDNSSSVSLALTGPTAATLARLKTAKDLEGFLLPVVTDPSKVGLNCLRTDQTEGDTIVLIVVHANITSSGTGFINADVRLLQVVPRLDKDKDKDRDKDKDKDKDK
jgi:hypothetical protein